MVKTIGLDEFSCQVVQIMPLFVREFAKRENHELSRGVITLPQMVALDYVFQKTNVTMTEIAKALDIKTSSASVLVDRLIRQKMLSRKGDEKDRRVIWIGITSKGKRVVAHIKEQKCKSVKAVFGHLTDRERASYLSILLKVKDYLGDGES